MKKAIVIPNPKKDEGLALTERLCKKLSALGIGVYIDEKHGVDFAEPYSDAPSDAELLIVVGGDGSVIDASRLAIEKDIPLIGVNLGKVGYLSEVDPEHLDAFSALVTGEYTVNEKMLLTLISPEVGQEIYAVNDIIVTRGECLEIASFSMEDSIGNKLSYRADGVIIATPQGSTAYSFSSGGPVLAHDVECMLVTPVCPHALFNRSVLFNAREQLTFTNLGERLLRVAADGRPIFTLPAGGSCTVARSPKRLKMLTFSKNSMFTELFKKMNVTEGLK
ncbi:MAG: NAD(+)/NADH kinase [Clostridia bacterium]|nr:NAD(+)/NADH kinase [Clostridia bacterium]